MPSLLVIVEQILNGHVQESTAALDLLSSLHGKSLSVEVRGPGITIVISAEDEKLRLEFGKESSATATVSGTPLALLASLRGDALSGFKDSGIAIRGDAEAAEDFSTLLRLARPDLEEQLSHLAGDVVAHRIGSTVRTARDWSKQAVSALGMNTTRSKAVLLVILRLLVELQLGIPLPLLLPLSVFSKRNVPVTNPEGPVTVKKPVGNPDSTSSTWLAASARGNETYCQLPETKLVG